MSIRSLLASFVCVVLACSGSIFAMEQNSQQQIATKQQRQPLCPQVVRPVVSLKRRPFAAYKQQQRQFRAQGKGLFCHRRICVPVDQPCVVMISTNKAVENLQGAIQFQQNEEKKVSQQQSVHVQAQQLAGPRFNKNDVQQVLDMHAEQQANCETGHDQADCSSVVIKDSFYENCFSISCGGLFCTYDLGQAVQLLQKRKNQINSVTFIDMEEIPLELLRHFENAQYLEELCFVNTKRCNDREVLSVLRNSTSIVKIVFDNCDWLRVRMVQDMTSESENLCQKVEHVSITNCSYIYFWTEFFENILQLPRLTECSITTRLQSDIAAMIAAAEQSSGKRGILHVKSFFGAASETTTVPSSSALISASTASHDNGEQNQQVSAEMMAAWAQGENAGDCGY